MQTLPPISEEQNLTSIIDEEEEFLLHPHAADSWLRLKAKAISEGINLRIVSAFRSVARQEEIIERKRRKGISDTEIFRVSAPAGFSEHHSGRAIDITTDGYPPLGEKFETSEAFHWLQEHAVEFGFILSYPRNNQFGIAYEPWHWLHKTKHNQSDVSIPLRAPLLETPPRSKKKIKIMQTEFDEERWPDLTQFRHACLEDAYEVMAEIAEKNRRWYR
ncbi:M15 family metallopeptidase, partial [Cerasicoccus arenae]